MSSDVYHADFKLGAILAVNGKPTFRLLPSKNPAKNPTKSTRSTIQSLYHTPSLYHKASVSVGSGWWKLGRELGYKPTMMSDTDDEE